MIAAAIGLASLGAPLPSTTTKDSPNLGEGCRRDIRSHFSDLKGARARTVDANRHLDETLSGNKTMHQLPALSNARNPTIKERNETETETAARHPKLPPNARPIRSDLNNLPRTALDTPHVPMISSASPVNRHGYGSVMDPDAVAVAHAGHHSLRDLRIPPNEAKPHQNITIAMPQSHKNFPETLFEVVSLEEHDHIVSWLPHGRGFIIHNKEQFTNVILPLHFNGAKFNSFMRRLRRWNFVRVPQGPELGAYYNKNFVRGCPERVQKMRYQTECQFDESKDAEKDKKRTGHKEKGANEQPPMLSSVVNNEPHHNQAPLSNIPRPVIKASSPKDAQVCPLPFPDSLPETMRSNAIKRSKNHPPSATEFPPSAIGAYRAAPYEHQMMDMEQNLLLARSLASQKITPHYERDGIMSNGSSAHPCYSTIFAPQQNVNNNYAWHAKRMEHFHLLQRDPEHILAQNHAQSRASPPYEDFPKLPFPRSNGLQVQAYEPSLDMQRDPRFERILEQEATHMLARHTQSMPAPMCENFREVPLTRSNEVRAYEIKRLLKREAEHMLARNYAQTSTPSRNLTEFLSVRNNDHTFYAERDLQLQKAHQPPRYEHIHDISQPQHDVRAFDRHLCEAWGEFEEACNAARVTDEMLRRLSREDEEKFARYLILKKGPIDGLRSQTMR